VIDNAIKYNKYDTQFYKVATRLRALSKVVFPQLNDVIVPRHLQGTAPSFEVDQEEVDPSAQYAEASNRLGDLEPPLRNVELLFSNEAIREHEDMEFLLGEQDPISALVAYELGEPKQKEPSPPQSPLPLPPPPLASTLAPAKSKAKGKSKRKGAKSHAVPMDVEQLSMLDSTPGFRAPVPWVQGDTTQAQAEWSPIFYVPEAGDQNYDNEPVAELKGKRGKGKTKANTVPSPTLIPIPVPGASGPEHEPHLIETIDKQQSFKMFNEGWILPPDQKRGGRAKMDLPPLPSKKKKPRVYLSVLLKFLLTCSLATSQPSISKSPPHQPVELPVPLLAESTEDVMDVDVEPSPQPQTEPELEPEPEAQQPLTRHGAMSDTGLPVQSIQESVDSRGNRIVIIEELDTPATRRERTRRAKAERARLAETSANIPEASTSGEHDRAAAPTLDKPGQHLCQEESDLSSLSGESDEGSGGEGIQASTSTKRGRGRAQTQGKVSRAKSPGLGDIPLPPGERLESGTLGTFLTFPASGKVTDDRLQFGRSTFRTLGGAQSCMMTTCRKFQTTSCNKSTTIVTTS
jgi:hypothetical protein